MTSSSPHAQTTLPRSAETDNLAGQVPIYGFVVLGSEAEPHRTGEVGFCEPFETLFLGRGEGDGTGFVRFAPQLPGEPLAARGIEGCLLGTSFSRRQAEVVASAVDVKIKNLRDSKMFIDGVEQTSASIRPGQTVLFEGAVLLLCVQRPRVLPALREAHERPLFGEPSSVGWVGESPAALEALDALAVVAATDEHVLILGESGTGKEMASELIHGLSSRAGGPRVTHNSANLTESVLQAQLFGVAEGFLNRGEKAKVGVVAKADHGTLFLDEIGDLTWTAQTQLLRLLDCGEYDRVGEKLTLRADVRFVVATNRPLDPLRGDFAPRFESRVQLPPLRERKEDIPLMVRHYVLARERKYPGRARRFLQRGAGDRLYPRISLRFLDELVRHPLTANVRDLRRLMKAAMDASLGDKIASPPSKATGAAPASLPTPAPSTERPAENGNAGNLNEKDVLAALEAEGGNKKAAAARLGLKRTSFYRLLGKLKI